MDWQPIQDIPCLSPDGSWNRLKPPLLPSIGLRGYREWMNGSHYFENENLSFDMNVKQKENSGKCHNR